MNTKPLKTCDILLYKGRDFNSRLIQWGTKSFYSHIAVVVHSGMHLGIESNVGHQAGVRAFDLRKLDRGEIDTFRVKSQYVYESHKAVSYLVAHLGAKYDWGGVIVLGAMKVASFLTGFKLLKGFNRFQKAKDYFCSELVYEAFAQAGLDIVPEIGRAEITSPGDIANSTVLEKLEIQTTSVLDIKPT